jgi:hypothetical protein
VLLLVRIYAILPRLHAYSLIRAGFIPPYALQQILSLLSENTPEARLMSYYWAAIVFVAHLSFAQVDLYQAWHSRRCYERTRGQLFCTIHYKALKRRDTSGKVQHEEEENADLGKIVNLMQYVTSGLCVSIFHAPIRGDTYAVAQRFWDISALFAAPVRLGIALIFLYQLRMKKSVPLSN